MATKGLEDIACVFPSSLKDALHLQADEKTRGVPIAGGTDLLVQWESGVLPMPDRVIHVRDIPELRGIEAAEGAVVIGAACTHMEIRNSRLVLESAPALAAAAATVGGAQMQAQGTIAGSIANASPAGDLAPSLMVAETRVVLGSLRGEREVPIVEFFTGYRKKNIRPDELIVRFVVPVLRPGEKEGFRKLGPRRAQAISKIMGAFRGKVTGGRIDFVRLSLGSVAPVTIRLSKTEAMLVSRTIDEQTLSDAEASAAAEVSPITDIRSTADYRKWVAGRLVRSFLAQLIS